jgi:hypothetical protein
MQKMNNVYDRKRWLSLTRLLYLIHFSYLPWFAMSQQAFSATSLKNPLKLKIVYVEDSLRVVYD